jgi:hypothetical protein
MRTNQRLGLTKGNRRIEHAKPRPVGNFENIADLGLERPSARIWSTVASAKLRCAQSQLGKQSAHLASFVALSTLNKTD